MLLGEVTSKQRSEGKRGLARQREEEAMVFHAERGGGHGVPRTKYLGLGS